MARPPYWTREKCSEVASKYEYKTDLEREHSGCYSALKRRYPDLLNDLFPKFKKRIWYYENIKEEALKYTTKQSFRLGSSGAYSKAIEMNIIDEVCVHMTNGRLKGSFDLGAYIGMSGLYFLYDNEELVYIGKSEYCMVSRIRDHYKDKEFNKIELYEINNISDMVLLECYTIVKNKPKYNVEFNFTDESKIIIDNIDNIIGEPIVVGASFGVNGINSAKGK